MGCLGSRIFRQVEDLELGTEGAFQLAGLQGVGGIGEARGDLAAGRVQKCVHYQKSAAAQRAAECVEDGAVEVVRVEGEVECLRRKGRALEIDAAWLNGQCTAADRATIELGAHDVERDVGDV